MHIERTAPRTSTIDILDRVLDKGIVIDAQVRVSLVGLHLVDIDARVIVASIETYVKHAASVADVRRQPSVIAADARPRAVSEPVRRRRHAAQPRRERKRPLVAYRCTLGCAFWRVPTSARTTETAACPYRPDVLCELRQA